MCTNANSQIAAIASSVCRENVSGTYGSGMTKNGVRIRGTRNESIEHERSERSRSRPSRRRNPATNDVHPVMNRRAGRTPRASTRTRRPRAAAAPPAPRRPSRPKNASTPPAIHVDRNQMGCGTIDATNGGVKRMPPPMTLATMMAAASNGPSRLSRVVCVDEGTKRYCVSISRAICHSPSLVHWLPPCLANTWT